MKEYFAEIFSTPRTAVAQIIGFMAMASAIICFQQKDRKRILVWQLIVCSLWTAHFIVLGNAPTGVAINAMQILRTVIFRRKEEKKWAQWNGWLPIFCGITVALGVITWESAWSILPIIGTCFSNISLWMKKPLTIRLLTFPVSITWGCYDLHNSSIAGACNEAFCIISLIIAILRIDIPKLKEEKAQAANAAETSEATE